MAALIGETWLTTTTAPGPAPPPRPRRTTPRRPRGPCPGLAQRLATGRAEVRVRPPPGPHLGGHRPERPSVELAVVDLDPPVVDLDGEAGAQRLGRAAGPWSGLEITRVAPDTSGRPLGPGPVLAR